jgi:5'-nucleotidase
MRPLILLSNDDGVTSPYLSALADGLAALGDVMVIAPERQRSAMSHTITLHKPLRVVEVAPGRFSASGSPVDCVYLGVLKLCPRRPALVVSGINDGFNLGTDVFYSGTVGAAVEGALRGLPSLAVSLQGGGEAVLDRAVALARAIAERLLAAPLPSGTVLNLNVPRGADGRYRWTRLGRRMYQDDVHVRADPRGQSYYWIGGGEAGIAEIAGSDCEAVYAGLSSITPLHLDLTAHGLLGDAAPFSLDGFQPG